LSARRIQLMVYGDSLGLPRATEGIPYTSTYAEVLRSSLETARSEEVDLYNRSRGGATIRGLYEDWATDMTYFGAGEAAIVVIQSGIVDCAPRPIPTLIRRIVGRLPGPLHRYVVRFLHVHRVNILRAGAVWRETPPDAFSGVLRRWLNEAGAVSGRVYVVNIAPTTMAMDAHSPGLAKSIEEYNRLISSAIRESGRSNVRLVDVHEAILGAPDGVSRNINPGDGHHITADGHALYARLIVERELELDAG
jgi:hypothetical protein